MHDFILAMHLLTYYQVLLTGLVATGWGIFLIVRGSGISPGFRSAVFLTAGTGLVQGLWGSILFISGSRPNDILHLVYGLIAIIGIPVAFTYASEEENRRDVGVLTFAAFAIFAAALRAYSTGVSVK